MRRSVVVLTCLTLLAVAASLAAVEKEQPVKVVQVPISWHQAALSDGAELYAELCAVCHGMEGTGNGPAAKAVAKPVPDLTLIKLQNDGVFPRKEIDQAIRGRSDVRAHGTLDMPMWGRVFADARLDRKPGLRWALAEQRIHNLTAHLETIQRD